eukprot:SAG31_NODE_1414_length_8451_cov_13.707016_7_plen_352_part_00
MYAPRNPGLIEEVCHPAAGPRTGVWRTHTPSCVQLRSGGFRMYYSESGPGLHWTQAGGRILSAVSADGKRWTPEPGVRLGPHADGAELNVTSPELVPAVARDGRALGHRLYYEAIPSAMKTDGNGNVLHAVVTGSTHIRSAFSLDGGLTFELEEGVRFGAPQQSDVNYGSARCVHLQDGRCRLYLYRRVEGTHECTRSSICSTFRSPAPSSLQPPQNKQTNKTNNQTIKPRGAANVDAGLTQTTSFQPRRRMQWDWISFRTQAFESSNDRSHLTPRSGRPTLQISCGASPRATIACTTAPGPTSQGQDRGATSWRRPAQTGCNGTCPTMAIRSCIPMSQNNPIRFAYCLLE